MEQQVAEVVRKNEELLGQVKNLKEENNSLSEEIAAYLNKNKS